MIFEKWTLTTDLDLKQEEKVNLNGTYDGGNMYGNITIYNNTFKMGTNIRGTFIVEEENIETGEYTIKLTSDDNKRVFPIKLSLIDNTYEFVNYRNVNYTGAYVAPRYGEYLEIEDLSYTVIYDQTTNTIVIPEINGVGVVKQVNYIASSMSKHLIFDLTYLDSNTGETKELKEQAVLLDYFKGEVTSYGYMGDFPSLGKVLYVAYTNSNGEFKYTFAGVIENDAFKILVYPMSFSTIGKPIIYTNIYEDINYEVRLISADTLKIGIYKVDRILNDTSSPTKTEVLTVNVSDIPSKVDNKVTIAVNDTTVILTIDSNDHIIGVKVQ